MFVLHEQGYKFITFRNLNCNTAIINNEFLKKKNYGRVIHAYGLEPKRHLVFLFFL